MKKSGLIATALAVAIAFAGCGLNNMAKGGLIGAGAGAAIGAGIGKVAGNTAVGAIVGTAVGGTAGALIGKKMDKQKKELEAAIPDASIQTVNDGEAILVTFDSGILFATNSSTLNAGSRSALAKFAANMNKNLDTDIRIIGHTDNTGSDKINDPLSERRAQSVYSYLNSQGVSAARMTSEGRGSHEPVADNSTQAGRAANRRVEVYILPNAKMIEQAQNGTLK
ncbi:OmpA family protein [Porphyromonas loveana]|uniref:OmpA family protein n=1 Tax=Porphyromonas loveana TaxID=1884669 RepID=UPI0035A041AB